MDTTRLTTDDYALLAQALDALIDHKNLLHSLTAGLFEKLGGNDDLIKEQTAKHEGEMRLLSDRVTMLKARLIAVRDNQQVVAEAEEILDDRQDSA